MISRRCRHQFLSSLGYQDSRPVSPSTTPVPVIVYEYSHVFLVSGATAGNVRRGKTIFEEALRRGVATDS